jgi:4-hydroxy-3-methylbut-2-enyl diphosphate reductase
MAFKQFDRVPNHYSGPVIQRIKDFRENEGKRSLAPTRLTVGQLEVLVPRHFGFCYGVERAIHMAFSAMDRHPDKRFNLVSEIIHNPLVNDDLEGRGVRFMHDQNGERLVSEEEFREHYDTTCPFVSKVWTRGEELAREGYTIIIHGKYRHEETQATRSHTQQYGRTLVVLDREEALKVAAYVTGRTGVGEFREAFEGKWSEGFDPERDLARVAVVNQTTMLAEETKEVATILRDAMAERYGSEALDHHFADTADTLCYATNWNQNATRALLDSEPDLAVIVGGYNSSNTSHLVEICERVMPSYLIGSAADLLSRERIRHYDIHRKEVVETGMWLPEELPARLVITSGASCPDVLMDDVVQRIAGYYGYDGDDIRAGLRNLALHEPAAVS